MNQFVGGGTTAVEAKPTNRNFIGVDINPKAVEITKNKLNFECEFNHSSKERQGDTRNLSAINDGEIDLICTHPPYSDIIHYSEVIDGDMSLMPIKTFLFEIGKVAEVHCRVLKKTGFAPCLWAIRVKKVWFSRFLKRATNAEKMPALAEASGEKKKPFFRGERKELLNGAGFDICEELTPQDAEKFFCRENLLSG